MSKVIYSYNGILIHFQGSKCCQYSSSAAMDVAPWSSDTCPSNDVINCPTGRKCEDNPPSCFLGLELEGISPEYNGYYSSQDSKTQAILYEDSKQLYVLRTKNFEPKDKCIWWYRPSRHWMMGRCEHVRTNNRYRWPS